MDCRTGRQATMMWGARAALAALLLVGCDSSSDGAATPDATVAADSGGGGGVSCTEVTLLPDPQGTIKKDSRAVGEACTGPSECSSGACASYDGGRCTASCDVGTPCPGGTRCWQIPGQGSMCLGDVPLPCGVPLGEGCSARQVLSGAASGSAGFGEACGSGDDCASSRCLATATGDGVCVQSCASSATCPDASSCLQLPSSEKVCAPESLGACGTAVP